MTTAGCRFSARRHMCVLLAIATLPAAPVLAESPHVLPGFEKSPHFDEQVLEYAFEPDVLVQINAPSAESFDPALPVRLVLFALPNGNTIAQTVGRRMAEGLDWHYDIQHIGAQTRALRKSLTDCNLVVAYLESAGRSWPRWRTTHDEPGSKIVALIDSIRSRFNGMNCRVELTAHSGGGSMLLCYIDHVDAIPDWVTRFAWLDADYAYEDAKHGAKLVAWLKGDPAHALGVYAYDDRDVTYNGKPIVGPNGGTYRRTVEMRDYLAKSFALTQSKEDAFDRWRDDRGQIEIVLLANPDKEILHTVMVEKNGFIQALTFGTPLENRVARFWSERGYSDLIQPE